jgi:hypothetical protein
VTITASTLEAELNALARMIDRLAPTHASNPERWHAEKSKLRAKVRGLLEACGFRLQAASPRSFGSPASDSGAATVRQARVGGGRDIPVERRGRVPSARDLKAARAAL